MNPQSVQQVANFGNPELVHFLLKIIDEYCVTGKEAAMLAMCRDSLLQAENTQLMISRLQAEFQKQFEQKLAETQAAKAAAAQPADLDPAKAN